MTRLGPNPSPEAFYRLNDRRKSSALSLCSSVAGEKLKPEIEAVARYFGGSRYQADPGTRDRIQDAIDLACRIVTPRMTFAIKPIRSVNPDGTLQLYDGHALPAPDAACRQTAGFLAAAIGTLGRQLELECRLMAAQHHIYQSTLLDAVGTAMLDALDIRIHDTLDAECHLLGLYSAARFAPGLNGFPLDHQLALFQLADGLSVDVCINEAYMMDPVKTISFFSLVGDKKVKNGHPDKCLKCSLPHCQFRKGPCSGLEI